MKFRIILTLLSLASFLHFAKAEGNASNLKLPDKEVKVLDGNTAALPLANDKTKEPESTKKLDAEASLDNATSLSNTKKTEEDIFDIRDVVPSLNVMKSANFWLLSLAMVFAASIVLYFLIKKLRTEQKVSVIILSPYEQAMQEIEIAESLKEKKLYAKAVVTLSFSLRGYLQGEFKFPAKESTTEEIFSCYLNHFSAVEDNEVDDLRQIMQKCDLAKFAKQALNEQKIDEFCSFARNFVERTNQKLQELAKQEELAKAKKVS